VIREVVQEPPHQPTEPVLLGISAPVKLWSTLSKAMPDQPEELISILMAITRDPSQARQSGRMRPLLMGSPHPKRRLRRWGTHANISAA